MVFIFYKFLVTTKFCTNFRLNNLNETIEPEDLRYSIIERDTYSVLKINNISLFDRGCYTLKAKNDFGDVESLQLFLNITDKPKVNIQSSRFNLINQPSHLTCTVYAYPEATVRWFFKPCEDDSCDYTEVRTTLNNCYKILQGVFFF